MKRLSIDTFLSKAAHSPILDVRSPGEYAAGHIPGAVSFPLFSDEERAIIGTLYKQQGRQPAIDKGMEMANPKKDSFIEEAEKLGSSTIALYCWRGGMRSEGMARLLEAHGFQPLVLEKGYKAYRNHLFQFFDQTLPLHVLTGNTGSKKTALLHLLRQRGEQVVDLEGLAKHQGSSFGNQKCMGQPTAEHFQNLVFEAFRTLDLSRPIWMEDESMRIGQVTLPEDLYQQKNDSPHFLVEVDKAQRVAFLVEDYGGLPSASLIQATEAIRRKLGGTRAAEAIEHIQEGRLHEAVEIILTYYDTRYQKSISRKEELIRSRLQVDMQNLEPAVTELLKHTRHAIQADGV